MIERHEEEIKQYLREKGFYPRKDKSLKLYIYQLRSRLKRNGKELVIKEVNDKVEVYIRPYREEPYKDKKISIRVSQDQLDKYKDYADSVGMSLSECMTTLIEEKIRN